MSYRILFNFTLPKYALPELNRGLVLVPNVVAALANE